MMQYPPLSSPADRRFKAEILGAVVSYIAARDCEIPYCVLQHEMAEQFGVGPDTITLDVMHAISALGWSGVVEISPREPVEHFVVFGADTTIKAVGHVRGFTHFERVPGPDDEEEATA